MKQTQERASHPCKYDRSENAEKKSSYPWAADEQLLSWVPSGARVLEVGCSTGRIGRHLKQQKGCRVWGVEQDAVAAEKASPFYETTWVGDLENDGFIESISQSFDVILCMAVLEHLNDPWSVLKKLKTRLNPKGMIILSLPNIAHWSIRWTLLRGRFDYQATGILDNTHLRFFTYDTAQDFVRDCGLTVVDISIDADSGVPWVQGLLRRIPKIGWRLLKTLYTRRPNLFGYQILIRAQ